MIINMNMNIPPAACIKQGWAGYLRRRGGRVSVSGFSILAMDPGSWGAAAQRARVPKPLIDKVGTMKWRW